MIQKLPNGRYVRIAKHRWVRDTKSSSDGLHHMENVGACTLILLFIFLALEAL